MAKKKPDKRVRLKKQYPKKCWGNEHRQVHAEGCRPGRPLCRWMRRVQPQRRACCCAAYHHPHRFGGGRCQHPERMALFVWGPPDDEREAIEADHDEDRPSGVYACARFGEDSTGTDDIPF